MTNTKARHEVIYQASVKVLDKAGGIETFDALPQLERSPALHQMAEEVIKLTDCKITSAKRNLAKALRRARYSQMKIREMKTKWER
ncbi:MAG: hypothetical protein V3W19_14285 [Desulfatiglandales bacterium]